MQFICLCHWDIVRIETMKYKSRVWDRYRDSQSYNDLVEYRIAQKKAGKEYKARKQLERNLVQHTKSNPKGFYAYMRYKTKVKDVVGPLKGGYNQLVSI
jgi:hypothetical protein